MTSPPRPQNRNAQHSVRDKLLPVAGRPQGTARDSSARLLAVQYVRKSCAPMLACVRAQPPASAHQDRSPDDRNFVVTLGNASFCFCYAFTLVLLVANPSNCRAAGDCLAQKAECIARKRKLRYNYRRTAFTAAYGGSLIGTLSTLAVKSYRESATCGDVNFIMPCGRTIWPFLVPEAGQGGVKLSAALNCSICCCKGTTALHPAPGFGSACQGHKNQFRAGGS